MVRQFKLGTKIFIGFAMVLLLLAGVGAMGYKGLSGVLYRMETLEGIHHLEKLMLEARREEKNFIIRGDRVYVDKTQAAVSEMLDLASATQQRFQDKVDRDRMEGLILAVKDYRQAFEAYVDFSGKGSAANGAEAKSSEQLKRQDKIMVDEARKAIKICADTRKDQKLKILNENAGTRSLIMVLSILALVIGAAFSYFLTRIIVRPLARVIHGLTDGAEQVASASAQVSSASQALAQGASDQAASIEETSSSLEEMSSMTRRNAQNASQADGLMKETQSVVEKADFSMKDLTRSMGEISSASEEISKIIKTIDEIAFQTNLLALNAAVEAARAGEAGAGFAVVADEVRNLAMRAAEAAKITSSMIEGTVKKVKDGETLVNKANEAFASVSDSASKAAMLVGDIASASGEQTLGIDQINDAVSRVDQVIQHNASSAEQSAAASEELSAQAEQMKVFVDDLAVLTGVTRRG